MILKTKIPIIDAIQVKGFPSNKILDGFRIVRLFDGDFVFGRRMDKNERVLYWTCSTYTKFQDLSPEVCIAVLNALVRLEFVSSGEVEDYAVQLKERYSRLSEAGSNYREVQAFEKDHGVKLPGLKEKYSREFDSLKRLVAFKKSPKTKKKVGKRSLPIARKKSS